MAYYRTCSTHLVDGGTGASAAGPEPLSGEIRFRDIPRSRAVRRLVAKRVAQWLGLHFTGSFPGEPRFVASLEREGGGHGVHCRLEIRAGAETWAGAQYGESLHDAITQCLAHMMRVAQGQVGPPGAAYAAAMA